MKKLLLFCLIILSANCVSAETLPLRLVPAQNIMTCYDKIEVGDKIQFMPVKNASYDYKKLNLKEGVPITGIVDYVQENGWVGDSAEIQFKKFIIQTADGQTKTVNSSLTINGFEELKTRHCKFVNFFQYCGIVFRGKEVDIRKGKDKSVYNIWVNL